MGSRNMLYIFVFRASSRVQMIPSERDLLQTRRSPERRQGMPAQGEFHPAQPSWHHSGTMEQNLDFFEGRTAAKYLK
jgi:hypothetical protein